MGEDRQSSSRPEPDCPIAPHAAACALFGFSPFIRRCPITRLVATRLVFSQRPLRLRSNGGGRCRMRAALSVIELHSGRLGFCPVGGPLLGGVERWFARSFPYGLKRASSGDG